MADELFEECLDDVLKELSSKGFAFTLKAEQRLALRNLLVGKDVLAVLPTGFGKSLIFQLFVLMVRCEKKKARRIWLR